MQGSGCGGAGQASTVHSVSLIVAWYVCGHAEAHRKLSVAARHVVSGGRARTGMALLSSLLRWSFVSVVSFVAVGRSSLVCAYMG